MSEPTDGGPWRGPSAEEWVERINEGASKIGQEETGRRAPGRWITPWIRNANGEVLVGEPRAVEYVCPICNVYMRASKRTEHDALHHPHEG